MMATPSWGSAYYTDANGNSYNSDGTPFYGGMRPGFNPGDPLPAPFQSPPLPDQGIEIPYGVRSGVVSTSGGYDPAYQNFLKQNPNWMQQNSQNGILSPQRAYGAWQAQQNNPGQSMPGNDFMNQPVYRGGIGLGNPPSITDNNPGQSMMGPSLSTGGGGGILSSNTNMNNGFISSNYSQPSNNMYGTNTNTNSTGKGMSSNNQSSGGTGKSM
jgi:hypothetical protein